MFAVESEIAETIARSLRAKLTREQQAVAAKPTEISALRSIPSRAGDLECATALPADCDRWLGTFPAVELDLFAVGWSFLAAAQCYNYREIPPRSERRRRKRRPRGRRSRLGEAHLEGMYFYKVLGI
jgi:hypothetical protein